MTIRTSFGIGSQRIGRRQIAQGGPELLVLSWESASLPLLVDELFVSHIIKEGYLFITVQKTIDGVTHTWRWSNQWLDGGEYLWEQKILNMPTVRFQAKADGGYIALNWGSLSFLPDAFVSTLDGSQLAPPREILIKAEWGMKDTKLVTVFDGEAYLRSEGEESLDYDLFEQEFEVQALDEGIAAGDSVKAVTAMAPYVGQDALSDEVQVTLGYPLSGLASGEELILQPVSNACDASYMGKHRLQRWIDDSNFTLIIPGFTSYVTESLECSKDIVPIPLAVGVLEHVKLSPTGLGWSVGIQKYYRPDLISVVGEANPPGEPTKLYDDSVEITSNFLSDHLSNRFFEPDTNPIGILSVEGEGNLTTLLELFQWGAQRLGLQLNYHHQADITLNFFLSEQMLLVDLLDQIAGYCNYSFYILDGTLHLFDNAQSTTNLGIWGPGDVFSLEYAHEMPSRQHRANWQVYEAAKMRGSGGVGEIPMLKEVKREVFIEGASPLGDVRTYKVFDQKREDVRAKIQVLKAQRDKPEVKIQVPLEGLPRVGATFTFLDEYHKPPYQLDVNVRDLAFNFEDYSIELTGKASITEL